MEKYKLPKGWKYEVFDETENPIAKYYSALTDYGEMIKFSDITHPKTSNMFAEFDDYINIKKEDLKGITFEQLLFYQTRHGLSWSWNYYISQPKLLSNFGDRSIIGRWIFVQGLLFGSRAHVDPGLSDCRFYRR